MSEDLRAAVASALRQHMDRGSSGRLIADYGIDATDLADAALDAIRLATPAEPARESDGVGLRAGGLHTHPTGPFQPPSPTCPACRPAAKPDVEALVAIIAAHPDMTDRSSRDGCECGHSDPRTYDAHLAELILASDWLAARVAEAGARALRDAAADATSLPPYYRNASRWATWLADRADRIEAKP